MLNIITKSWKDFFSFKMLVLNLLPIFISLVFWSFLIIYFNHEIFSFLKHFLPTSWQDFSDGGFFVGILVWLIKILLYIFMIIFVIILSLIINVFVSIFYTPFVIKYLHKKYYPEILLENFGNFSSSMKHFLKAFLWFLGFAILFIPLYYIPFLGIIALLIPHFFFFKNTMLFDVGSYIFKEEDFNKIQKENKAKNYQISFLSYLFSLIPIFNFFATILQTIIIAHFFLDLKKTTHKF